MMIVVSAATGEFGRLVIDRLLDRVPADRVAVAVRDPAKAEGMAARGVQVRYADYEDASSLRTAFAGADRLLFISSPRLEDRISQHVRVVSAARDAEVGSIAYTSGLGADAVDEGLLGDHHATEQAILASGMPHVFLRNPIYTEMFIDAGLRAALASGEVRSSTRDRGMNTATRADLAEAAAVVLTGEDPGGSEYNLTGPLWTYSQLAATLSELSGRTIACREVTDDEGQMQWFGPIIRSGGFEVQTSDLERLLGHPATSLRDVVAAALERPSVA